MKGFFLTPLVTSLFAAFYMASDSESHPAWQILVVLLVVVAAVLQGLDWFFATPVVHFLIPLMMQIIVSIGVYLYVSLPGR